MLFPGYSQFSFLLALLPVMVQISGKTGHFAQKLSSIEKLLTNKEN